MNAILRPTSSLVNMYSGVPLHTDVKSLEENQVNNLGVRLLKIASLHVIILS